MVGDWDGDGDDTVGLYRDGTWLLSNTLDQRPRGRRSCSASAGRATCRWWGTGTAIGGDTVGAFHDGTWTLTNVLRAGRPAASSSGSAARATARCVGDWDGDPRRHASASTGTAPGCSPATTTPLDGELPLLVLGTRDTLPLVGDWDGKAGDTIGVVR